MIGDGGTANNQYLPGYNYYNYSWTQQIYTADEIGMAGTINSIAFQNTGAEKTRNYKIYMQLTDKETFESGTDWVAMSDDDLVFEDQLIFSVGDWTTIDLATPFSYDGTSNLLVGVADVTGDYSGSPYMACLVFGAASQAIRAYRDSGAYDIAAPGVTGNVMNVKNQIVLDITPSGGGGVVVEKPQTFEVSGITSSEAVLTWTGGTGTYNVEYKKAADTDWTVALANSTALTYTLTGLESNTAYQARVQSVSGSDVSGWKTVSFTTAIGFPYTEDFTAGLPAIWARYTGLLEDILNNSATLASATGGWKVGTENSVLDGNHAYANIYSTGCNKWLVTPAILLGANAQIAFDVAYTAYSGTAADPAQTGVDDKFVVLISTDDMATWTILRQWDNAGSSFVLNALTPAGENVAIDLGGYAGQSVNVAFYVESTASNADNNLHIDNVAFQEKPACEKPAGLKVDYDGGTEATVSWISEEPYFDIDVNGTITEDVENPCTLTGLEFATTYTIKVRAKNSSGISDWTSPVSFTTDISDDMCQIQLVLLDSWGDGWNGNAAIQIADVATGIVIGTFKNDGSTEKDPQTVVVDVPNDRDIQFSWIAGGQYDSECSYTAYDVNGEEIFSGSGAFTTPITWHVNCTVSPWRSPTDLTASEITNKTVKLSWTENSTTPATAWVVAYKADGATDFKDVIADENPFVLGGLTPETTYTVKVRPDTKEAEKWSDEITFTTDVAFPAPIDLVASNVTDESAEISWTANAGATGAELQWAEGDAGINWYQYDDGTFATSVGLGSNTAFWWGVMFPAGSFTGNKLFKVSVYDQTAMTGTVTIYSGGDSAPETVVGSAPVTFTGVENFIDIDLDVTIDPAQNVWVVVYNESAEKYPAAASTDTTNDPNGRWVSFDGSSWSDLANAGLSGYCWMLRAEIGSDVDPNTFAWTTIDEATSPVELTGLNPETTYTVRVKSIYKDGESQWTMTGFTTLSSNPVPSDIEADLAADGTTLTWEGKGESYNVQYRTAASTEVFFFEDFEGGLPSSWTTIDADGDGNNWKAGAIRSHSGSNGVYSESYVNNVGALTPDNWLITPKLDLKGTMSVWLRGQDATWAAEHFAIYLSTATEIAGVSDFTVELVPESTATGEYVEYTADLSAYAGQQGYIAIRHFNVTDMFWLNVDDFGLYGATTPAGEWQDMAVTEKTATLSGLATNNAYEYQIQSVKGGNLSEWSEAQDFALLTLDSEADNTSLLVNNIGKQAHVTLEDRTLQAGGWNTFTVPFDFDTPGGWTVKKLAGTDFSVDAKSEGHLVLNFEGAESIEAGKPYLVKVNANVEDPTFSNVEIVYGTTETVTTYANFVPVMKPTFLNGNDKSVLFVTGGNSLTYPAANGNINGFRAYFKLADDVLGADIKAFNMSFDDNADGIESIQDSSLANQNDGAWFDLGGRKIADGKLSNSKLPKGIYIHNGRKEVIK